MVVVAVANLVLLVDLVAVVEVVVEEEEMRLLLWLVAVD